jgi:hypothetical protein
MSYVTQKLSDLLDFALPESLLFVDPNRSTYWLHVKNGYFFPFDVHRMLARSNSLTNINMLGELIDLRDALVLYKSSTIVWC